jgi:ABC-2 type transport system permease protein
VTLAVFTFMVAPPLVVQLANDTASWMPANLADVISGTVDDVSLPAALAALAVWALVPAVIGLISVQRRDVV